MLDIKKSKEINEKNGIFAVLYADSGTGKTTAIAEMGKNPLIIDTETGTTVLQNKDVDIVELKEDLSNWEEIIKYIETDKTHDVFIFDSISALEANKLADYSAKSKSGMPTLNDYGKQTGMLMRILMDLKILKRKGKNIIVTALEMSIPEQSDGSINDKFYPMLTSSKGKFAKKLVADADIVGRLEISEKIEDKRFIRLQKTHKITAKDRIFKRTYCEVKEFVKTKIKKGEKEQ